MKTSHFASVAATWLWPLLGAQLSGAQTAAVDLNDYARGIALAIKEQINTIDWGHEDRDDDSQSCPEPGYNSQEAVDEALDEALEAIQKLVNTTDFNAKFPTSETGDGLARRDLGPCATWFDEFRESFLNIGFLFKSAIKVALNPLCGAQDAVSQIAFATGEAIYNAADSERAKQCEDEQSLSRQSGGAEVKTAADETFVALSHDVARTDFNKIASNTTANSTLAGANLTAIAKEAVLSYGKALDDMDFDSLSPQDGSSPGGVQKRAAIRLRPQGKGIKSAAKPAKAKGSKGSEPKKAKLDISSRVPDRQLDVAQTATSSMTCAVMKLVIREGTGVAVEQGKAVINELAAVLRRKAVDAARQSSGGDASPELLPFLPPKSENCDVTSESCIGTKAYCAALGEDEAKCLAERTRPVGKLWSRRAGGSRRTGGPRRT